MTREEQGNAVEPVAATRLRPHLGPTATGFGGTEVTFRSK